MKRNAKNHDYDNWLILLNWKISVILSYSNHMKDSNLSIKNKHFLLYDLYRSERESCIFMENTEQQLHVNHHSLLDYKSASMSKHR